MNFFNKLICIFSLTVINCLAQNITIDNARINLMPKNAKNSALYFNVINKGEDTEIIKSIEVMHFDKNTPLANQVVFHTTKSVGNIKKMEHIPEIKILPHATFELKPGGNHVMLIGLYNDLLAGEKYRLKIFFTDGKIIDAIATVKPINV